MYTTYRDNPEISIPVLLWGTASMVMRAVRTGRSLIATLRRVLPALVAMLLAVRLPRVQGSRELAMLAGAVVAAGAVVLVASYPLVLLGVAFAVVTYPRSK